MSGSKSMSAGALSPMVDERRAAARTQLAGQNRLRQERNRAYLLIVGLVVCVVGLAIAVAVLARMHTFIPVIAFADANGHVFSQQVADVETLSANEAFVRHQVYQFVQNCNTFDPKWRQHYADLCHVRSSEAVAAQYDRETSPDNPGNPYYQVGEGGRRYVRITALSPLSAKSMGAQAAQGASPNTYQVAFQSITERSGGETKTEYFTALVSFAFTLKPMAVGDRWENPLGFVVSDYRKDQELSRR